MALWQASLLPEQSILRVRRRPGREACSECRRAKCRRAGALPSAPTGPAFSTTSMRRASWTPKRRCREMLGVVRLDGWRFLDIGCGSGLFSLAARRLGAKVHSFDFDPQSVACTLELRKRYFANDGELADRGRLGPRPRATWRGWVASTSSYSWGVLHHTGAMWLGPGAGDQLRGERDGQAVRRDLQRSRLEVAPVVAREGLLQPIAAVAAGTVRHCCRRCRPSARHPQVHDQAQADGRVRAAGRATGANAA